MTLALIFPQTPARAARLVPMSLWPEEVRLHVRRRTDAITSALERLDELRDVLIAKLDALDGDADLEPTLGSPEHPSHHHGMPSAVMLHMYPWARGNDDEREPDADLEASLAPAFRNKAGLMATPTCWTGVGDGASVDLEQEHDGREPQCEDEGAQCEDEGAPTGDDEPWLGAPEGALGYGNLRCGETDDREIDRSAVDPEPEDWSPRCELGMG